MRLVIQRVTHAECVVDGNVTGAIKDGFLVLAGISDTDDEEMAGKMRRKMLGLRIFADAEGKTNLSLRDVGGNVLLISQFTLYADCRKGNRPSFTRAGKPEHASALYEYIHPSVIRTVFRELGADRVQRGIFGADMKLSLLNDGPFTIILDSDELAGPRR